MNGGYAGDGNGFTGLNPSVAKANIDAFVRAMKAVAMTFLDGGNALFNSLEKTWCSPKAAEFADAYSGSLYEATVTDIETAAMTIARNAETAFNTVSLANGGPSLGANYGEQPSPSIYNYFGQLKEASESGIVGMNVMQVQLALTVYGDVVEKGLAELDAVPTAIALYDPDGSQQAAYKAEIQKVKENLTEKINSMLDVIEDAMETEQNNITLAKDNATGSLSA